MQQKKTLLPAGVLIGILVSLSVRAQDSVVAVSNRLQQRYASVTSSKVTDLNSRVESVTKKDLDGLIAKEKKMQRMVGKVDSLKGKTLFRYSIDSLKRFQSMISRKTSKLTRMFRGNYFPYLDTLKGSLSFLKKAGEAAGQISAAQKKWIVRWDRLTNWKTG